VLATLGNKIRFVINSEALSKAKERGNQDEAPPKTAIPAKMARV